MLCVNRSSYYAWDKRPESKRSIRKKKLTKLVKKEFYDNKQIPGAVKIAMRLSTPELPVNWKLVAKIMKEGGLKSKVVKKYKATTNSNHNLPNRDFKAERPNQKWVSDISVPTDEGWLYVAGILDLCGHEIAGWAMGDRMTKDLVIRCLKQARGRRGNPTRVLMHSDRGSQYCSNDYQALLKKHNFTCSMSRKGNCWDNAPMESFWGKLKQEWLNDQHFRTREEAKAAIFCPAGNDYMRAMDTRPRRSIRCSPRIIESEWSVAEWRFNNS